jgi:hypothetical protein
VVDGELHGRRKTALGSFFWSSAGLQWQEPVETKSQSRKNELDRMAVMLSRLGGRGYHVGEEPGTCGSPESDRDTDSDFDLEKKESQRQGSSRLAIARG